MFGGSFRKRRFSLGSGYDPRKRSRFGAFSPFIPAALSAIQSGVNYFYPRRGRASVGRRQRLRRRRPGAITTIRRKRKSSMKNLPTKKIRRYVKRITKNSQLDENVNVHRSQTSATFACAVGECNYLSEELLSFNKIINETTNASIGGLSASGQEPIAVDIDGNANVDQHITIVNAKRVFQFRNNGDHPCWLSYWKFICKRNAHATPRQEFQYSYAEKHNITSAATTYQNDRQYNVWDGTNRISRHWKMYKYDKILVNVGDTVRIDVDSKARWDFPSDATGNFQYFKNHSQQIIFRIEGAIVHDQVSTTQVSTSSAVLDYVMDIHLRYCVDESNKVKYAEETGALGTVTTEELKIPDME